MEEVFENQDEIETWLRTQPRDVILVFAARAASRSVPRFASLLHIKKQKIPPNDIIFPSLWAIATAVSAGKWSNTAVMIRPAAANAAYAAAGDAAHAADAAHATFAAADAAATADVDAADVDAAADAANAAAHAAFVATSAAALYAACSVDRDFINRGNSAQDLALQPLWGNMPKRLTRDWNRLKTHLLSLDQDWGVWTEWYEDRLRGIQDRPFTLPFVEDIEIGLDPENGQYGRITFPPEDYKDPAKVNAAIKKLIEDYRARQNLLEQDTTAETFGINADGKITRTTIETSAGLTNTPEQRDWYEALRQAALGMKDIGENALGRAARPVNNALSALPEDIGKAKVAQLWPAANRIRKLKAADERARASGDEYHPNRLGNEVVDDIGQFIEVYNNLVIGDVGLSAKDKSATGPQESETNAEIIHAANESIQAAIEHDLFMPDAQTVIEDDINEEHEINQKATPTILERLAQDNIRREKENAIRAIIIRVRDTKTYGDISTGAKMAIGAGIVAYVSAAMPQLLGLVMKIFG